MGEVMHWAEAHWGAAFLLVLCALLVLEGVCRRLITLATRFFRLVMVLCRGWPPAHLDADGDHVEHMR